MGQILRLTASPVELGMIDCDRHRSQDIIGAATFCAAKLGATRGRAMLTLREDVGHIFGAGKAAEHRLTFAAQMKPRTRGCWWGYIQTVKSSAVCDVPFSTSSWVLQAISDVYI
eukprot:scaffold121057_cov22-Cyclotella_meneghiniana.AAC.2